MIHKIHSIKNTVEKILQQYPETRDNDRLLILKVWAYQEPGLRTGNVSFREFGEQFKFGHYVDPESVRRSRQKIQENNPSLRGIHYNSKKVKAYEVSRNINQL